MISSPLLYLINSNLTVGISNFSHVDLVKYLFLHFLIDKYDGPTVLKSSEANAAASTPPYVKEITPEILHFLLNNVRSDANTSNSLQLVYIT